MPDLYALGGLLNELLNNRTDALDFFPNMQDFILISQVLRYSQQDDVILMKDKVATSLLAIP